MKRGMRLCVNVLKISSAEPIDVRYHVFLSWSLSERGAFPDLLLNERKQEMFQALIVAPCMQPGSVDIEDCIICRIFRRC
jgi:hypothetical protein